MMKSSWLSELTALPRGLSLFVKNGAWKKPAARLSVRGLITTYRPGALLTLMFLAKRWQIPG
ncbi:hypothetical protein [uncultured Varibaculum sp.]|uniref:hypothetical protein n=1 Tax=uncultured Varibaculum sp. TaxID=413896 RepID=UPI00258CF51B|nr:hypothetical protein [uncultured Varibaculum sp.]